MASGILEVPKKHLPGVILVIRAGLFGLSHTGELSPDSEVYIHLARWCETMELYLSTFYGDQNGRDDQKSH